MLPAPPRDVFLLGAAAFIAETTVQASFWAGLALHSAGAHPATARVVLDVAGYWGPLLTGATTTMIGAVTVLGLRSRPAIPPWLTGLGLVAFAEQALETITVFGTRGFTAPGGAVNTVLGAALTAIWLGGLVVWAFQPSRCRRRGPTGRAILRNPRPELGSSRAGDRSTPIRAPAAGACSAVTCAAPLRAPASIAR